LHQNKDMSLHPLTSISPIDGRYRNQVEILAPFFSEYGLIRYRVQVEVEYFIALTKLELAPLSDFPVDKEEELRNIYNNFTLQDSLRIKEIEKITNHDVKAVEYFLRDKWEDIGLGNYKEFIHFGLTSQDINNTAIPYSLQQAMKIVIFPNFAKILQSISHIADEWKDIPMLARTHGQPASPTRLGKEMMVFVERVYKQINSLQNNPFYAKFGGATGNFNAHVVAFPEINWVSFSNSFLMNSFGLQRNQYTTQVDHYDDLAQVFDNMRRINIILMDFCRDMWTYISMDYFKQRVNKDEVGSSAMPHKVNPIDFENAEGNFGIANALFEHFSHKLPISRLQRDLTDSTVLRNIGVPIAHSLLAYTSMLKGISKLIVNEEKISMDLENNWAVVAEAIQTILRREGFPDPYEKLKQFSRGKSMLGKNDFEQFIESLEISNLVKEELRSITPFNYTGV
jgi:adenylosuccinate lyase